MDTIRMFLVGNHQVVPEGLRHMLRVEEDIEVGGEAADTRELFAKLESLSPEMILMDIKKPGVDGIEFTRQIKEKQPSSNVIMLTFKHRDSCLPGSPGGFE